MKVFILLAAVYGTVLGYGGKGKPGTPCIWNSSCIGLCCWYPWTPPFWPGVCRWPTKLGNCPAPNDPDGKTESHLETCPCQDLSSQCNPVPLQDCRHLQPDNATQVNSCIPDSLFDKGTGNLIINIGDRTSLPCGNLGLGCKCSPIKPPKPPQSQCGKRNPYGVDVKITGFTESQTQIGEFPWMVAVMTQDTTYVAGGSLVHPKVILTAGHKVHGKHAADLIARIGDWDLKTEIEQPAPQNINVDRIVFHDMFNRGTLEHNVALLILKNDVVYSKLVMSICLPQPNQMFDGSECFTTGWGKDVFGDQGEYQTIMKKIPMTIVSHRQCQTSLRNTRLGSDFTLHNSFVCAGGQGEDACAADGGSPLVCPDPNNPTEYVQVGVVSWGIGCKTVGNPGVYGSIPKTVSWITETIHKETGLN